MIEGLRKQGGEFSENALRLSPAAVLGFCIALNEFWHRIAERGCGGLRLMNMPRCTSPKNLRACSRASCSDRAGWVPILCRLSLPSMRHVTNQVFRPVRATRMPKLGRARSQTSYLRPCAAGKFSIVLAVSFLRMQPI